MSNSDGGAAFIAGTLLVIIFYFSPSASDFLNNYIFIFYVIPLGFIIFAIVRYLIENFPWFGVLLFSIILLRIFCPEALTSVMNILLFIFLYILTQIFENPAFLLVAALTVIGLFLYYKGDKL